MKFRDFLRILEEEHFTLVRQAGSHRMYEALYEALIDGQRRIVTVAGHRESDDIRPGTLASMIRQSGLPRQRFRDSGS